ncbi:MAG: 6-bladed beta-propeller [Acidobacteriota bacterium]
MSAARGTPGEGRRALLRAGVPACGWATMLLLAGLACQHKAPRDELALPRLVWPPPPAPPRIEHIGSFREPSDLGIRRNWLSRLFTALAGTRRPTAMVRPYGIAVTPEGRIAVADPGARCVHLYDPGRPRYRRVRSAANQRLVSPVGVAIDPRGRIYVADSFRRAIFRYGPKGEWLDTLGEEEGLVRPTGLAFEPVRGILYVVDTGGHRVLGFDAEGNRVLEFGRRGSGPGEFNYPAAIAVGPSGDLYVTDSMNFRVQVLDPGGRFLGSFGGPGDGPGDFDKAKGIALDADGHIYVVEGLHDVIHVYDGGGRLLTVLGGTGSGRGRFWLPTAITIDGAGRILISDSANRRVQILRYLGEPGGRSEG